MKVYVSRYHMILMILTLIFCVMFKGCTTTPSGAFEHNTISYYVDGKFYDELPEEYIFKTWGYRIIKAHFNPTEDGYYYWVNRHPRSL